jgi:hypothetical protein
LTSPCTATKRNGSPCTLPSNGPSGLCWAHDPKNAEKRRRGQSRGGKNKPSRELAEVKREIRAVIGAVLSGRVERGVGAVLFQGYNCLLKAAEVERRVREQDELLTRVEELERAAETNGRGGGRRWG